eukprot:4843273-Prymnesium_polylepis.1
MCRRLLIFDEYERGKCTTGHADRRKSTTGRPHLGSRPCRHLRFGTAAESVPAGTGSAGAMSQAHQQTGDVRCLVPVLPASLPC